MDGVIWRAYFSASFLPHGPTSLTESMQFELQHHHCRSSGEVVARSSPAQGVQPIAPHIPTAQSKNMLKSITTPSKLEARSLHGELTRAQHTVLCPHADPRRTLLASIPVPYSTSYLNFTEATITLSKGEVLMFAWNRAQRSLHFLCVPRCGACEATGRGRISVELN